MHKAITNVIFDFDGTLVDSAPAILATFAAVLDVHEIAPRLPLGKHLIGPPLLSTLRALSGIADDNQLGSLADDFKQRYDGLGIYATEVYAGVDEMLHEMHSSGRQLHIATNKRQHPTFLLLEHFGWSAMFSSVYCADTPAPPFESKDDMLRELMMERGLQKDSTIFVGDTRSDAMAALGNGLPFLIAKWGYGDWPADAIAESWSTAESASDIICLIEAINRQKLPSNPVKPNTLKRK